jgi:cathepsin C
MVVDLQEPNLALGEHGERGTWTMVYDEGFEVAIGGRKYFAFSKYVPKTPASLEKDDVDDYISVCDETLVGWFHREDGSHWGCYHAYKMNARHGYKGVNDDPNRFREEGTSLQPLDSNTDADSTRRRERRGADHVVAPSAAQRQRPADDSFDSGDFVKAEDDPEFAPDVSFIELVNTAKSSTWRAGVHSKFLGKRTSEMMQLLGWRRRRSAIGVDKAPPRVRAARDDRPDAEKYADLPEAFDWRNVKGVNYDSPVRNQGNCGSCYAMATTSVMEARVRIMTHGKDTTLLSPQGVVSCSIYNQGCDGGYPYLVAKHAQDFGVFPDGCMPYTGTDESCHLHRADDCPDPTSPRLYTATNYSYVGGYYGSCTEAAMMEEIFRSGPIMVAFDAPSSLFYYTGGVFTGSAPPHEGPRLRNMHPWEKTNHAVVAVGWGVTADGIKYWIVKNTWGEDWGEHGYFRIRRGTDECGIESMASTLQVGLPRDST